MAQRAIDFSLMSRREIDCRWTPLSHDAMVAVLPPDHPLAKADAFPIERLLDEPFVELYPRRGLRQLAHPGHRRHPPAGRLRRPRHLRRLRAGGGGARHRLMNDIYARTAEAEVAVVPLAPARIVEIGIAAPPGAPPLALAALRGLRRPAPST